MPLIQIIVLALIQGLTEYLPVSSSAHLILGSKVLGWPDQGLVFDVATHLGTLVAVLIYFWHELMDMAKACLGPVASESDRRHRAMVGSARGRKIARRRKRLLASRWRSDSHPF